MAKSSAQDAQRWGVIIGACALLIAAGSSKAQQPPVAPAVQPFRSSAPPLTLGECVRRALTRGFDLELERQSQGIAQEEVPIAHSLFDPVIAAEGARIGDRSSRDATVADLHANTFASTLGVSERLVSGATVRLGSSLNRYASNQPLTTINGTTLTTLPNSLSYTNGLSLDVTQPLLRGFGSVNAIPIRRAEVGVQMAGQRYEDRALDVIQRTESAYYLLTGSRDRLSVLRTSLELAERLLDEVQARHTAGMATKIDLLEAQVGIANARLAIVTAENGVHSSEDQLLALIGRFELNTALGATVVDDTPLDAQPTVDDSYARALEQQPALRQARSQLDLTRLELAQAKDDLKPSVDLGVTLGLGGDDPDNNRAWSNVFGPERSTWQAGLSVTYPLGRVGEKARFRQSSRALTRDELGLSQLEQTTLVALREAIRDVQTSREGIRIASLAASLANQQYEAELMRYRSGLSTSRRVLEAQEDLESARVAELQARLDLRTSFSRLYRIEGSSLARYGFAPGVN